MTSRILSRCIARHSLTTMSATFRARTRLAPRQRSSIPVNLELSQASTMVIERLGHVLQAAQCREALVRVLLRRANHLVHTLLRSIGLPAARSEVPSRTADPVRRHLWTRRVIPAGLWSTWPRIVIRRESHVAVS